MKRFFVTACVLAAFGISPACADESKTITFRDLQGEEAGRATLTDTSQGLLVHLDLTGLPPGDHAFHIHSVGNCDAAEKFTAAGDHLHTASQEHGYKSQHGPHAGDMPNLQVDEDGKLRVNIYNDMVMLSKNKDSDTRAVLLDEDGAAFIIHAAADDYTSQPAGAAGDRIVCAEVK